MAWRWTARRLVISAFVLFHLSALIIWTMPPCYIKDRFARTLPLLRFTAGDLAMVGDLRA